MGPYSRNCIHDKWYTSVTFMYNYERAVWGVVGNGLTSIRSGIDEQSVKFPSIYIVYTQAGNTGRQCTQ